MSSSAEQIHHSKANMNPEKTEKTRLYIDLDICRAGECKICTVQCSYFYHPENNGILSVAELAAYYLVCRRCEEPHCVNACPASALEQQKERGNMLIRHSLLCIGCRSCSHACPYGTIYPENVPLIVHNCDFCLDRRDKAGEPLCIKTCPYGALSLKKGGGEEENTFLIGDDIIAHSTHWDRSKA